MKHNNTFLNVEKSKHNSKFDATFVGINFCSAKWLHGVQRSAKKIRKLSYKYSNADGTQYPIKIYNPNYEYILHGLHINDYGDIKISKYSKFFEKSNFPIFVGGDHAATYYILKNIISDDNVVVIQFDAHSDYLDDFEHCPHGSVMKKVNELNKINKIIHCGLRGNLNTGPGIAKSIENGNVVITRDDLNFNELIKYIDETDKIYISIDTDFFDVSIAPGTNCPEPNGFLYADFFVILTNLLSKFHVVGIDFVEYNPKKDPSDITGVLLTNLIIESIAAKNNRINNKY
nr:arginase family protein [Bacilli bacterium]